MKRAWIAFGVLAMVTATTLRPLQAQTPGLRFRVVDLGSVAAAGIDEEGDVVGTMLVGNHNHAFLYQDGGGLSDLFLTGFHLGGDNSGATAVSNSGGERHIAGYADTAGPNLQTHAIALGGGGQPGLTDLNGLGAFNGGTASRAQGINAQGDVVGFALKQDGTEHAFRYSQGGMIDLGTTGGLISQATGINSQQETVGSSALAGSGNSAAVWSSLIAGGPFAVPVPGSEGLAISDSRIVVGRNLTNASPATIGAFSYDLKTSAFTQLPPLAAGNLSTEAHAVNNSGWIVGFSAPNALSAGVRAVIWRNGAITDLNALTNGGGWTLNVALGINSAGQIIGYGTRNRVLRSFRLDPIDVPPTIRAAAATPRTLTSAGGSIRIQAFITDPTPLAGVTAQVTGATTATVTLLPGANNQYAANFLAPPNASGRKQIYKFTVVATNTGGQTVRANAGKVTVSP